MKVERTKYTAHYENGIVIAQWVSVEMLLDGESPLDALDRSKELVDQWYKSNNIPVESNSMPPGPSPIISVERTSEDIRIADLIRSMYACTRLDGDDGLFSFHTLASTNVETKAVYDVVKNKLVAKESNDLLVATKAHVEELNRNKKLNK